MPRKAKNEASAAGLDPVSVAASRPKRACATQNPPCYASEPKKHKANKASVAADAPSKKRSRAGPAKTSVSNENDASSGEKKNVAVGKGKGTEAENKLSSKEGGGHEETVVVGEETQGEEKENGGHKDAKRDEKRDNAQEEGMGPVEGEKAMPNKVGKISQPKSSGLQVGDALPDLKLADDEGKLVSLHELVEESGVVIYAYPKANTPGCTQQSLLFKEHHKRFSDKSYRIFGISADPTKSQASWKNKLGFPFSLLSDLSDDRRGLKQLGFLKSGPGNSVLRSHIVVAKGANGGRIEQVVYGVKPKESAEKAMQCIGAANL